LYLGLPKKETSPFTASVREAIPDKSERSQLPTLVACLNKPHISFKFKSHFTFEENQKP